MALSVTIVAEGQMATTETDMYAPTGAVHCNLYLFNTNAADQTVILFLQKSGGTSRKIWQGLLSQNWSAEKLGFRMGNGDKLRGLTTTATAVNYVVEVVAR